MPAEEARDLAQDTVTRTIVHLRRHGRSADDLTPLLNTIARNLLVERVRRNRPALTELTEATEVADPTPGPDEAVLSQERRNRVREGLSQLSPRHRRVVQMWMDGLGPSQIASQLGIKRNAADALLHRARRRLAASLRQDSLLGIGVLVLVGLRSRVRRAVAYATSLDPTGSMVPASAGMAALGIAAVIAAGSAGTGGSAIDQVSKATDAATVHSVTLAEDSSGGRVADTVASSAVSGDDAAGDPGVDIDIAERRITAAADDPTEEEDITLDIWHERDPDEDNRGAIGPVIEDLTVQTCEGVIGSCQVQR